MKIAGQVLGNTCAKASEAQPRQAYAPAGAEAEAFDRAFVEEVRGERESALAAMSVSTLV